MINNTDHDNHNLTLFYKIQFFVFVFVTPVLYPGFNSYTEGATWKILDLLTETLLI